MSVGRNVIAVCADDWKVWLFGLVCGVIGYYIRKEGGDWDV